MRMLSADTYYIREEHSPARHLASRTPRMLTYAYAVCSRLRMLYADVSGKSTLLRAIWRRDLPVPAALSVEFVEQDALGKYADIC